MRSLFFGIALCAVVTTTSEGQVTTPQGTSPATVLSELSASFSGGHVVQQVQLSGNAIWYAENHDDSGAVSLTATSNGSSQVQLQLESAGARTETQAGAGLNAQCQWAGNDGVAYEIDGRNCWKPELWFLPALSLQPSMVPSSLTVTDLGMGTVGSSSEVYRHLQSQLVFSDLPNSMSTDIARTSTTDLGLDPTTLLPAVLAYSLSPGNGALAPIAVEIHYSNYRVVSGVQIPFLIQRYVNGFLQLQVSITTAQIG